MPAVNHTSKLFAGVIALLNGAGVAGGRIYSGRAPQTAGWPRIIIHEISGAPEHQHDSATTADAGEDDTVLQLDFDALTVAEARALADTAAGALNGYRGDSAECRFGGLWRASGGRLHDLDHDAGQGTAETHRISVDYRARWRDKP